MAPHRILQMNALSTGASAVGLLAARGSLYGLFGLSSPALLDALAAGLIGYAGAMLLAARRPQMSRTVLLAFTAADVAWVLASAAVLMIFWGQLTPLARLLVVAVAVVVEIFATLQFRAAGSPRGREVKVA